MIIDSHTHLGSDGVLPRRFLDSWADNVARDESDATKEGVRRLFEKLRDEADPAHLIREMDAARIDKAILLLIDFGLTFPEEAALDAAYQRHRDAIAAYPDRLIAFAGIDPRRGLTGVDLFERAIRDWGFKGLKLYPPCGFSPSDSRLWPYYDVCRSYGVPVLSHVGPTASCLSYNHTRPEDVDDVAHRFPGVNFILGHAGVTWYKEAALLAEYRPNVYMELSGFQAEVRRGDFVDILKWHKTHGVASRLLFGTDWPIHRFRGQQQIWVRSLHSAMRDVRLSDSEIDRILWKNAAKLMSLSASEIYAER